MAISRIGIVLAVFIVSSAFGAIPANARGALPPPPRFFAGGNSGGWLGSGPLFGFDDPLGDDFYPGGDDGSGAWGGTTGFEWGGSSGSGNPVSSNCEQCKCNKYLAATRDCVPKCACQITLDEDAVKGKIYPGECATAWDVSTANDLCCQQGDTCWGIPNP